MRSICLFSSYFKGTSIPFYVRFYLTNLRKHFTDIVYINNTKNLDLDSVLFLENLSVDLMYVENEGYDFGMWYKAIQKYPISSYDRLALINDSCILFRNIDHDFTRLNNMDVDFSGMVISDRIYTHLQSFFLVYNKACILPVINYFQEKGIIESYRDVIQVYEIGLCKRLLESGLRLGSLYNNSNRSHKMNPSFSLITTLIDEGIPMIKKKIVFRNYKTMEYYWLLTMNFNIDYKIYLAQIKSKYNKGELIDFDKVMHDAPRRGRYDIWLYEIFRKIINVIKLIPGSVLLFNWIRDIVKKIVRGK